MILIENANKVSSPTNIQGIRKVVEKRVETESFLT